MLCFCVVTAVFICCIGREKFINWEFDSLEQLTRVITGTTTAAGAFLIRQAIAVSRNQQLCIALKPYNGKLSQRNIYMLPLICTAQLAAKASTDTAGNFADIAVAAMMMMAVFNQLSIQYDWINFLYNGCGQIAVLCVYQIRIIPPLPWDVRSHSKPAV